MGWPTQIMTVSEINHHDQNGHKITQDYTNGNQCTLRNQRTRLSTNKEEILAEHKIYFFRLILKLLYRGLFAVRIKIEQQMQRSLLLSHCKL